jgi:hypothetical protein
VSPEKFNQEAWEKFIECALPDDFPAETSDDELVARFQLVKCWFDTRTVPPKLRTELAHKLAKRFLFAPSRTPRGGKVTTAIGDAARMERKRKLSEAIGVDLPLPEKR